MVTQILNFGLPTQIDVRTVGYDRANNLSVAKELQRRIANIPGIVDAHLQQELDAPAFYADIDRTRGAAARPQRQHHRQQHQRQPELVGAGHAQLLDRSRPPASPITSRCRRREYQVSFAERSAQHAGLDRRSSPTRQSDARACSATWRRSQRDSVPTNTNQTNIQPVYDVYASVQGRDLGSVATEIEKIVADLQNRADARQHDPGHRARSRA